MIQDMFTRLVLTVGLILAGIVHVSVCHVAVLAFVSPYKLSGHPGVRRQVNIEVEAFRNSILEGCDS